MPTNFATSAPSSMWSSITSAIQQGIQGLSNFFGGNSGLQNANIGVRGIGDMSMNDLSPATSQLFGNRYQVQNTYGPLTYNPSTFNPQTAYSNFKAQLPGINLAGNSYEQYLIDKGYMPLGYATDPATGRKQLAWAKPSALIPQVQPPPVAALAPASRASVGGGIGISTPTKSPVPNVMSAKGIKNIFAHM